MRAVFIGAVLVLAAVATVESVAAQSQAPSVTGRQTTAHPVVLPISARSSVRSAPEGALEPRPRQRECRLAGWVFFVVTDGECMSLTEVKELARYPDARPGEFDAGYGWRGRKVALLVGYTDPQDGYIWQDQNPATASLVRPGDSGLFGLSAVLRLR